MTMSLTLTLDCETGKNLRSNMSIPQVDTGQRFDVKHCRNADVGTYISQVHTGGDVPLGENQKGIAVITLAVPDDHIDNVEIGDEIHLMMAQYFVAKCRILDRDPEANHTTQG